MKLCLPKSNTGLVVSLIVFLIFYKILSTRFFFDLGAHHEKLVQVPMIIAFAYLAYPTIAYGMVENVLTDAAKLDGEKRTRLNVRTEERLRNLKVTSNIVFCIGIGGQFAGLIMPPNDHYFLFLVAILIVIDLTFPIITWPVNAAANHLKEKSDLGDPQLDVSKNP